MAKTKTELKEKIRALKIQLARERTRGGAYRHMLQGVDEFLEESWDEEEKYFQPERFPNGHWSLTLREEIGEVLATGSEFAPFDDMVPHLPPPEL